MIQHEGFPWVTLGVGWHWELLGFEIVQGGLLGLDTIHISCLFCSLMSFNFICDLQMYSNVFKRF